MKLTTLLCVIFLSFASFASELDREMTNLDGSDYAGTVILRINEQTNKVEMFETDEIIADDEIQAVSANFEFQPVAGNNLKDELDREAGASSWYFYGYGWGFNFGWGYNHGYTYPTYYRYGYNYRPYYNYGYRGYRYYCYRWY